MHGTETPSTSVAPQVSPSPNPIPTIGVTEAGKDIKIRWRWESGLFNVVIWTQANGSKVAASYGGLYEGPSNFSPKPGGLALLDALSGKEIWRHDTPTQAFPAAFNAGVVAVGTGDGTVFAWDEATGAERWRLSFDGIPFQVMRAASVFVVADADPETWGPNGLVDKTRLGGRVWGVDPATGADVINVDHPVFVGLVDQKRQHQCRAQRHNLADSKTSPQGRLGHKGIDDQPQQAVPQSGQQDNAARTLCVGV